MRYRIRRIIIFFLLLSFIMVLTACEDSSVIFTFDANGGEFEDEQSTYVVTIDEIEGKSIPTPSRDGYIFRGWFLDNYDFNEEFNIDLLDTTEILSITVYAKWDIDYSDTIYTITFITNGGSPIGNITVIHNEALAIPSNPIRTGYIFNGWYIDKDLETSAETLLLSGITENISLYAKWTTNDYIITLDVNQGNSLNDNTINVTYNASIGQIPLPTKEGYSFIGWNSKKNGEGIAYTQDSLYDIANDTILYAQWSVNQYYVYFETLEGSIVSPHFLGYGSSIMEPTKDPETDNYSFAGWYVDSDYSSLFDFNNTMPDHDITLYAKWTYLRYKIWDNRYIEITGVWDTRPDNVELPEYIMGYPIEIIGSSAFAGSSHRDTLISIDIPSTVRLIYNSAFEDCINLKTVTMRGVTKIFQYAFKNCSSLESITFSCNLDYIEFDAFRDCTSLREIIFPNSVTHIGLNSFRNCINLNSVAFGSGLSYIGGGALHSTAISSVSIPDGVFISGGGDGVFQNCTALIEVILPSDISLIPANTFNGCTSLNSIILSDSIENINSTAFHNTGILNNAPDGVLCIGKWAIGLKGSSSYITIPEGIEKIAESAFLNSSIISITLADSVTHIGKEAFRECSSLNEVIIGKDSQLKEIGNRSFYNCISLLELTLPSQLEAIEMEAFEGCSSLERVIIYSSDIRLYFWVFKDCSSLKLLAFMEGMPNMFSSFVFENISSELTIYVGSEIINDFKLGYSWCADYTEPLFLIELNTMGGEVMNSINALPGVIIKIDDPLREGYSFSGWFYDSFYINEYGKEPIGANIILFARWSLEGLEYTLINANEEYSISKGAATGNEVIINNTYQGKPVTKIAEDGFRDYTNLELIVLPYSITNIGSNAFEGCSNIINITILATTPPTIGSDVFANVYQGIIIYVPFSSLTEYQTQWSEYSDKIDALPRVIFNSDGGSEIDDINVPFNSYIVKPTDPIKTGYIFSSWYLDEDLTVPYDFYTLVSEDITLYADWGTESLNYIYNDTYDTYSVRAGSDKTKEYIRIPVRYNGKLVTAIENMGFYQCNNLINIDMPYSIQIIGDGAFYYCLALEYINIPSSVQIIGEYVFEGCSSLVSIEFGLNSVLESIGYSAFANCVMLSGITLPDTLDYLGYAAFNNCASLVSINIPAGISLIGYQTFNNCTSLESVTLNEGLVEINDYAFAGCQALKEIIMPNSLEKINAYAFAGCLSMDIVQFNSTIYDISNTAFDSTLWFDNQADGIIYAGKLAYGYKGVMGIDTTITIIDSTVAIADSLFFEQVNLISVTLPDSLFYIGEYAFYGCLGLESIIIPDSVLSIKDSAFSGCLNLLSVYLPSGLDSLSNRIFNNCNSLESIILPNGIKSIGEYSFSECLSLTSITIPNTVESIGPYAFNNITAMISFEQDSVIAELGNRAFQYYKGTSLSLPNSIVTIGAYTMSNSSNLNSLLLPANLESIGNYAFSGCASLNTIIIPNTVESIGQYAFNNITASIIFEQNSLITVLGDRAFQNYKGASLSLPNSIVTIGASVFMSINLGSITIPEGVTTIGNNAFQNSSLITINLPSTLTTLGGNSFIGCSALISISVAEENTHFKVVNDVLYYNHSTSGWQLMACPATKTGELEVYENATSIHGYAFAGTSLTKVRLPATITSITNNAFNNATSINELVIYAANPPTIFSNSISGIDISAIIYVSADSVTLYQNANYWKNFEILALVRE